MTKEEVYENVLPHYHIKITWDRYGQFKGCFVCLITSDEELAKEFENLDAGDIEALDVGKKILSSCENYASADNPIKALEKSLELFMEVRG